MIVDAGTELGYYGARYYDNVSLTWTQGDPMYRFAPDWRRDSPRRALLYSALGNNALRYTDPDGRDIVQDATNAAKVQQTARVMTGFVGKEAKVQVSSKNGVASFKVFQTQDQKKAGTSRAVSDLIKLSNDSSSRVVIHNVDSSKNPGKIGTEKRDQADRADKALAERYGLKSQGGALTLRPTKEEIVGGVPLKARVIIDYSNLDKTVRGQDVDEVENNAEITLGHELLTHPEGMDEKEAREYENKHIRNPRGVPQRETELEKSQPK